MKAISAAAVLFVFTATSQVNAQEDVRGALETWLNVNDVPGLALTHGAIEERDDQTVIEDIKLEYQVTLDSELGVHVNGVYGTWVLDFSLEIPETVLHGLEFRSDGVEASKISYPEDMQYLLSLASDRGRISVKGGVEEYSVEGFFFPALPEIADDPDRPVSRFVPLIRALQEIRVDRAGMGLLYGEIDTDLSDAGGGVVSGKFTRRDIVLSGWENGVIGAYDSGEAREEYTYPDENGKMTTQVASTRELQFRDYNLFGSVDLLQLGSIEETVVLGSMIQRGYLSNVSGQRTSIDEVLIEGVTMKRPDFDVLGYMDSLITGSEVDDTQFERMYLETLRSFSLARAGLRGISVDAEQDGNQIDLNLSQFLLSDLGSEGLGEFSMTDLEFGVENFLDMNFEKIFIKDVDFPSVSWMRQVIDSPEILEDVDPLLLARAFTPTALTAGLGKLSLQFAGTDDDLLLNSFHTRFESAVSPIPTLFELTIDGFEISADMIEDPDAVVIFEGLGIEKIALNEDFRIAWDEATGDVTIDRLVFDLGNVGKVSGRMQIGGVPRFVLENPEKPEALMVTANLKSLELDFENAGAVEAIVTARADNDGTSEVEAQTALLLQALNNLSPFASKEVLADVEAELSDFLENPISFRVTLKPENPLPVAQIAAGFMTSPQTLPQLLGLTIEANH
ncbi:hypothetical protein K1W69_04630 [Hoeflea sp. WL0058]|uniref:Uncharacterized protein n=1 Tax=Flavimaribacter sediminis TaxID=2865987 RepID=A0AAE2ZN89_9HYPH|nr:hypothetical protein [Flavimaribacter sediminis]MBW8636467.1 hypothetical protein [Flavimaribacter sediminis]